MNKTKIEWVHNPDGSPGYTFNPITGCLNHINGLCKGGGFPCYAYKLANGRLRSRYLANTNVAPYQGELDYEQNKSNPFYPRFWEDRLFLPFNDKHISQKGIFVCDMSDLFGIGIPEKWTKAVMDVIEDCPTDRFYLLTKQPQNLLQFSPFPDNCWVGVTATNQKAHNEAIVVLANIEASTKFISHEPLLEYISLHSPYSPEGAYDWDIIGSQTKPYKPSKIEGVEEIVRAADKAGIPVFLKDNLKPLLIDDKGYPHASVSLLDRVIETGTWELRQEMPNGQSRRDS